MESPPIVLTCKTCNKRIECLADYLGTPLAFWCNECKHFKSFYEVKREGDGDGNPAD